jgi:Domain of unknown function (DUF1707)
MRSTAQIRIGDAERNAAAAALGEHFAAGRLDRAEFDERVDLALRARTGADLEVLFTDLPRPMASPRASRRQVQRRYAPPVPVIPILLLLIALAVALDGGASFLMFVIGWFLLIRLFWWRRAWLRARPVEPWAVPRPRRR